MNCLLLMMIRSKAKLHARPDLFYFIIHNKMEHWEAWQPIFYLFLTYLPSYLIYGNTHIYMYPSLFCHRVISYFVDIVAYIYFRWKKNCILIELTSLNKNMPFFPLINATVLTKSPNTKLQYHYHVIYQ